MGNADTKLNFRKAVVQLTSKSQVGILFSTYAQFYTATVFIDWIYLM